jgi:choice-of-anchor B domain-containing protein
MKLTTAFAAGLLSATTVAAAANMEEMMSLKTASWERAAAAGAFDGNKRYKKSPTAAKCKKGMAGEYPCKNVDLLDFISHEDLGATGKRGNDVWGWTSKQGREFGIVGNTDGVAFVEVGKKGKLTFLGRLDTYTETVSWRDIKVIKDHAYIGSEANNHGMQIFDLNKLLDIDPKHPVTFDNARDLTAHFDGFGASHNLVAHPEVDMIYAVGGRSGANARNTTCAGGMFMVDVSDPSNPTSPGCIGQAGYVHDAECVIYRGPHKAYYGQEICFGYNEDTLTIYDTTDKQNPIVISETPYIGNAYSHQGWIVDEAMTVLLLDDELDELNQAGPPAGEIGGLVNHTTTYIFDISNLETPINTGYYQSPETSIDHNQYVSPTPHAVPCRPKKHPTY